MLKDLRKRLAIALLPESEVVRYINFGRRLERSTITNIIGIHRGLATDPAAVKACDDLTEVIGTLEQL